MLNRNRALIGLVVLLVLATAAIACSDENEADAGSDPTQEVVTEEETPLPGVPGGGVIETPPGTTASANGREVEMGIGTYCWGALCVDKIGPVTKARLAVAGGDKLIVAVPDGTAVLNEVNVQAFPAQNPQEFDNGETAWQPDFSQDGTLAAEWDEDEVRIPLPLQPGTYVLVVGMYFDAGDVQYGVVLDVE